MAANNQVSFGLMARDDLYIDTYVAETMGDYVAAGTRNQGAFAGFGRKSGDLYNGPAATHVYAAGDTLDLEIAGSPTAIPSPTAITPPPRPGSTTPSPPWIPTISTLVSTSPATAM